jgi:serine/threonine-protein kinase
MLDKTVAVNLNDEITSPPAPGEEPAVSRIDYRYEIVEKLGSGGMGSVFKCFDSVLKRHVAVKLLHPQLLHDERAVKRLQREAEAAAKLSHPNVVQIFDCKFTPGSPPIIVMDYVDGQPLDVILERCGRLPMNTCLDLAVQICRALEHAHGKGIVHRDIKPSNILVVETANQKRIVKVLDFGIAKSEDANTKLTVTGELVGTPLYMSPEQCRGQADARADQYSLACVLFQALTARTPILGENAIGTLMMHMTGEPLTLAEAAPDLTFPAHLEKAFKKALAKEPQKRFFDISVFCDALLGLEQAFEPANYLSQAIDCAPAAIAASDAAPSIDEALFADMVCERMRFLRFEHHARYEWSSGYLVLSDKDSGKPYREVSLRDSYKRYTLGAELEDCLDTVCADAIKSGSNRLPERLNWVKDQLILLVEPRWKMEELINHQRDLGLDESRLIYGLWGEHATYIVGQYDADSKECTLIDAPQLAKWNISFADAVDVACANAGQLKFESDRLHDGDRLWYSTNETTGVMAAIFSSDLDLPVNGDLVYLAVTEYDLLVFGSESEAALHLIMSKYADRMTFPPFPVTVVDGAIQTWTPNTRNPQANAQFMRFLSNKQKAYLKTVYDLQREYFLSVMDTEESFPADYMVYEDRKTHDLTTVAVVQAHVPYTWLPKTDRVLFQFSVDTAGRQAGIVADASWAAVNRILAHKILRSEYDVYPERIIFDGFITEREIRQLDCE